MHAAVLEAALCILLVGLSVRLSVMYVHLG